MVMLKLTIEFYDDYAPTYKNYRAIFKRIYDKTMEILDYTTGEFLVEASIVSEDTIKSLNKEYRNIDAVTDVLSFAFNDIKSGHKFVNEPFVHLGSIIICAPVAVRQARELGHEERREFTFLFTHGLLHLLGYNHQNEAEEQVMINLQDQIIGKRGGKK